MFSFFRSKHHHQQQQQPSGNNVQTKPKRKQDVAQILSLPRKTSLKRPKHQHKNARQKNRTVIRKSSIGAPQTLANIEDSQVQDQLTRAFKSPSKSDLLGGQLSGDDHLRLNFTIPDTSNMIDATKMTEVTSKKSNVVASPSNNNTNKFISSPIKLDLSEFTVKGIGRPMSPPISATSAIDSFIGKLGRDSVDESFLKRRSETISSVGSTNLWAQTLNLNSSDNNTIASVDAPKVLPLAPQTFSTTSSSPKELQYSYTQRTLDPFTNSPYHHLRHQDISPTSLTPQTNSNQQTTTFTHNPSMSLDFDTFSQKTVSPWANTDTNRRSHLKSNSEGAAFTLDSVGSTGEFNQLLEKMFGLQSDGGPSETYANPASPSASSTAANDAFKKLSIGETSQTSDVKALRVKHQRFNSTYEDIKMKNQILVAAAAASSCSTDPKNTTTHCQTRSLGSNNSIHLPDHCNGMAVVPLPTGKSLTTTRSLASLRPLDKSSTSSFTTGHRSSSSISGSISATTAKQGASSQQSLFSLNPSLREIAGSSMAGKGKKIPESLLEISRGDKYKLLPDVEFSPINFVFDEKIEKPDQEMTLVDDTHSLSEYNLPEVDNPPPPPSHHHHQHLEGEVTSLDMVANSNEDEHWKPRPMVEIGLSSYHKANLKPVSVATLMKSSIGH
ncbi:hypothetical protein DASC09_010220 [Saccharomycopsis crataegensis]|uniref:Uncharacterized protein n=1 Tax=Saccharomycopsis crataegensis TaxID=43959 RepID=A0AAV5QGE5_9ASCO|nr:hypothetical protein DASC09_010220 [Saccharomycopsis crataegensis]